MYYLEMKTVIKPVRQSKTIRIESNPSRFTEKQNSSLTIVDFRFYQKLLILLISLSTILIFPESPKELETVCNDYYSKQICQVW